MGKVVVLGSLNEDLMIETERLPQVGETLMGKSINYFVGGKGANQAVAAARASGEVSMLGKVGNDTFGEKIMAHLRQEKIQIEAIASEKNMFTGTALVFKLPNDNCITVIPGANDLTDTDYITEVSEQITDGDILLAQLEIPIASVLAGLKIAKQAGVTTILNPAPFNDGVLDLLPFCDVITPNEGEFSSICTLKEIAHYDLENQINLLEAEYNTRVIVTRGSEGVSLVENSYLKTIPTIQANVLDTTGAGDTFSGVLAALIANQVELTQAIRMSSVAATMATEKIGAQTGMPVYDDLLAIYEELNDVIS